jgi:hypothetical protein
LAGGEEAAMTTLVIDDRPDTDDMLVIHRIFRRGFTELATLVAQVPPGDTGWAASVADHIDFMLNGLHNHHTAEDEHLWPLLLDRAKSEALLVGSMADQHTTIVGHTDRIRGLVDVWRSSAAPGELDGALEELSVALGAHLDQEEAEVVPLISQHIAGAEWRAMGDASFAKFTNPEKLVALGQMLDVATPEEAAPFLAGLPLPVRAMWRVAGRRKYRRYMREVRGIRSRH